MDETRERYQWLQNLAVENLKERAKEMDAIKKTASTWMGVMITAIGGLFSWVAVAHLAGPLTPLHWSALSVSVWLTIGLTGLVWRVMRLEDYPATYNAPKNLWQPDMPFFDLWATELSRMQTAIDDSIVVTNRTAASFDKVQIWTVLAIPFAMIAYKVAHDVS